MSVKLLTHERLLVFLDHWPLSALWRVGVGYLVPFVYYSALSNEDQPVLLIVWFFCVLIALRVVPVVVRKIFPFSAEVNAIWAQRRRLARVYDSYQWAKLVWFGIGIAFYLVISGCSDSITKAFAALLIVGGGFGIAIWRRRCVSENVDALGI